MSQESKKDLVQLSEDPVFRKICPKCQSDKNEVKDTVACHESCTTGSIAIVCSNCGFAETIYEPY